MNQEILKAVENAKNHNGEETSKLSNCVSCQTIIFGEHPSICKYCLERFKKEQGLADTEEFREGEPDIDAMEEELEEIRQETENKDVRGWAMEHGYTQDENGEWS